MLTFEVATDRYTLGKRAFPAGNTERIELDFSEFLEDGAVLSSVTAAVTDTLLSSVSTPTLSNSRKAAFFYVITTSTDETFMITIQAVTTDGQTLNYMITIRAQG